MPAGCPNPPTASAVFFGTLGKKDFRTAQFTVVGDGARRFAGRPTRWATRCRCATATTSASSHAGTTYIVGVTPDPKIDMLTSKVRVPAPLFGGDAVAGADDSDVTCPTVEDPVITLTQQATSVDTGLFTPLHGAKRDLLMAVLRPLLIAFAVAHRPGAAQAAASSPPDDHCAPRRSPSTPW